MDRNDPPSDPEDAQPLLSAFAQEEQDNAPPPAYPATENYPPQPPGYQPVALGNPCMETKSGYHPVTVPGTVIHQQPMRIMVSPQEPKPSAVGAITFSCCVFWCCCLPFGLAAFIFAVLAAQSRTAVKAARHIRLSHAMSCAGLVSGIVIALVTIDWSSLIEVLRAIWSVAEVDYSVIDQIVTGPVNATMSPYSY